jgi:hypothetical protein
MKIRNGCAIHLSNYQTSSTVHNDGSLKIVDVKGMLQIVQISRMILDVTFACGI